MANALFDMDSLKDALERRPLHALLDLATSAALGRIDVVSGGAQGVAGPQWDSRAHMLVRLEIAAPVFQEIQASAQIGRGEGFNGFDVRRQLEEQNEGGFPETLKITDTEGNRYRIVTMQGGDGGTVLVLEKVKA